MKTDQTKTLKYLVYMSVPFVVEVEIGSGTTVADVANELSVMLDEKGFRGTKTLTSFEAYPEEGVS